MSEKEIAISVNDLHVRYKSMKARSFRGSIGRKKQKVEVVDALKGVSFDVEKGQILGIVGKNGSGKSTLLRTLAGIFSPDGGSVDVHNNTVSLLAIGVGFQKELPGRDNIILTGLLLGFTMDEIMEKMPKIIKFSGLKKFIDKPVRTYSSGMFSKLSFSISAILEPDILLVDEVLSVGDARFKKKSFKKMQELISDENRTVVIVSHNMNTIQKLCDTVLWINEGEFKEIGPTKEVLDHYIEFMEQEEEEA
ncbi:ABC transporter ATP-binding protein [Eubacterium oxidoreducens]|uniref:Teichoic acid transport system ATP-binding protein n=1 Tax=Eubacterium oxidoreducens TaxID=1732 RepID=A0A1G6AD83_EUBOX|nr:ABC transporter ATP-binding protein [Eubacterium oxidoreducens]SDB06371.1 teichoic acid transport system ATP-binding protein [Eubacterium oxidoreducens]